MEPWTAPWRPTAWLEADSLDSDTRDELFRHFQDLDQDQTRTRWQTVDPFAQSYAHTAQIIALAAASSGPIVAAIKTLPEFIRSRRKDVSLVLGFEIKGRRVVTVELTAANADEAVQVIEQVVGLQGKLEKRHLEAEQAVRDLAAELVADDLEAQQAANDPEAQQVDDSE
ncbi:effector-associated constant component EACC1 [Nocardia amamiensis]|uniref:effector-associated constant component EACC1 n=1 Tax=Nocardia amamiensis TaxID=404578 RepID=UPI0033E615D9